MSLSAQGAMEIKVLEAVYGDDSSWADVKTLVETFVQSGTKEIIVGSDTMQCDPAPGKPKSLRLVLRDGNGLREITTEEGKMLSLPVAASLNDGVKNNPSSTASEKSPGDGAKGAPTPTAKTTGADGLSPEVLSALVTISDGKGSGGTGFICTLQGKNYLFTNQHVIAGVRNARFQTHGGHILSPGELKIAVDADLAMMTLPAIPKGIKPLTLMDGLAMTAKADDAVTIPGNSLADDVITQTHGKLLAVGGGKVETDCPIYAGNSGSPIIHRETGKVIGALTFVTNVQLDPTDKVSFRSKKSALKSEVRYFGYRIDTVSSWKPATATGMNAEKNAIDRAKQELEWIIQFFTGSSDEYKQFPELHDIRNQAEQALGRRDLALSEQQNQYKRFLWRLESLVNKAVARLPARALVFCHQRDVDTVKAMANFLKTGVEIADKDDDLTVDLIKGS